MINFLMDNIVLVLAALIILIGITLFIMWRSGKKEEVKKIINIGLKILQSIILGYVAEAEKKYGSGTGPIKKADVLRQIYNSTNPVIINLIKYLPEETIAQLVEDGWEEMTKLLSEGKTLTGYDDERSLSAKKNKTKPV